MQDDSISYALERLLSFSSKTDLTSIISKIENDLSNQKNNFISSYLSENALDAGVLQSAVLLKNSLGQINVIIHALGIVNLLKKILDDDEVVEELSIGAGNTKRPFDLVTNKRIAEFKFINWSGKQDAIRQNSVFKDFFELEVYKTDKKKYLYVLDKDVVLKFFTNNRALDSVLSKNETTRRNFYSTYGSRYRTVSEYYKENNSKVEIVEIRDLDMELFKSLIIGNEKESKIVLIEEKKIRLQKDIISECITGLIETAKVQGITYVDIKAGDVGKATGFKKSFPNICRIMKQFKKEKDIILSDTPSGMGSSVTIRYFVY
ncbi:MAG: hypothetical protein ACYDG2_20235 [Ruminiclostridium sp.]